MATAKESKEAWDKGDFKLASRIFYKLRTDNPELVLVQRGDGVICKKVGDDPKSGDPILEAL